MKDHEMRIRTASPADAEELLDIYAPYVRGTAISFEYEVPAVDEFRERIRRTFQKFPYLVAEHDGAILGYAYAGKFKERVAYSWNAETSIYVRQERKRMGIGSRLYGALENILREQGFLNMNACIACPEVEDEYLTRNSVEFHRRLGFSFVGEFHKCGYKFGRWYNMVWMEKHIGAHCPSQPAPQNFENVRKLVYGKYQIE